MEPHSHHQGASTVFVFFSGSRFSPCPGLPEDWGLDTG